ncbi:hypothetical protein [Lacisediminihabitans changchengi]|uniref:Uncharacterized protein n=1 Tax=Lacisediminihabitans changchengi TaxID=2787634 RepID=A0A934VYU2_9MICO|nr:hypothetical protein [Lacisediminihabitans changchengi]MBK4348407.1 hypothetical protein [Lacisediminihabitans changchengi]
MSIARSLEIVDFDFDVPTDFSVIPLEADRELNSAHWARSVVAEVVEQDAAAGAVGDIVDELTELRRRLLARQNPWLRALVSIRSELELTIGAIVEVQQFPMDDDDSVDSYEQMVTDGLAHPAPGTRTHIAETWRSESDAGTIVGAFHRFDIRDFGDAEGRLQQRTIFAVFPPDSSDMVRFIFTVADLATFEDMIGDTQAIVETLRVTTEESVI